MLMLTLYLDKFTFSVNAQQSLPITDFLIIMVLVLSFNVTCSAIFEFHSIR